MPSTRSRVVLWVHRLVVIAVVVLALVTMFPVLAGPVTGDDRYWYPWMGVESWTPLTEIQRLPEVIERRVGWGRVNFLTESERRIVARAGIEASVLTSTPVSVFNALLKVSLTVVALACAVAMVRSLRWRGRSGELVRASRRTLFLIWTAGTLGVAAIARPHALATSGGNGWGSYPTSTYGAVVSIFGVVALALWFSRLIAERGRATTVMALVVMALIGVATNFRYELAFPAVPLVAVALVLVPVTSRAHRQRGRRAKLLVAAAYFGGFAPIFVVTRLLLRQHCQVNECYAGVQPSLGTGALRTFAYNVVSVLPGTGEGGLADSMRAAGLAGDPPSGPTLESAFLGLLVVVALAAAWWASRLRDAGSPDSTPSATAAPRDEALLLVVGAVIFVLGALGAAAVMSVSVRAQELITEPGVLYRNAVVTGVGLVFALVMLVVATGLVARPRVGPAVWGALALAVGVAAAVTLPSSLTMLQAQRINFRVSDAILAEIAVGDPRPLGDVRRCRLVREMGRTPGSSTAFFVDYSDHSFQRYHHRPFCTNRRLMDVVTIHHLGDKRG